MPSIVRSPRSQSFCFISLCRNGLFMAVPRSMAARGYVEELPPFKEAKEQFSTSGNCTLWHPNAGSSCTGGRVTRECLLRRVLEMGMGATGCELGMVEKDLRDSPGFLGNPGRRCTVFFASLRRIVSYARVGGLVRVPTWSLVGELAVKRKANWCWITPMRAVEVREWAKNYLNCELSIMEMILRV